MSSNPPVEVEVRGLAKNYGKTEALKGISFRVTKGEIFGLIGADGAGKTTTFHILAGILNPTAGEVQVAGQTGYLTQRFSLYQDLSVIENLRYNAGLHKVSAEDTATRGAHYLELFGMSQFAERRAGRLSGGMKQKLALCCALIAEPQILLLDEPTTGVDPASRRDFWDALTNLAAEGMTIIVATPYLDEAERCHRVALIDRGRIHAIDTPANIRQGQTLEAAFVQKLEDLRGKKDIPPFPERRQSQNGNGDDTLLAAQHLKKRFGAFEAVKDFTMQIRRGEVYGLLGANGAGKTTAIKMMCGLLEPTRGEVTLLGHKKGLREAVVRRRLGYMSQKFTLYDDLTIGENLDFYTRLYGVPERVRRQRKQWVLEVSELAGQESLLTAELPGGWKQRVAFGAAILHEPDLIFLDEPTSGVDPIARRAMWRMIGDLADNGAGILVVTHYLEEAEQCSHIGFMVAGEMLAEGSPEQVRAQGRGRLIELDSDKPHAALGIARRLFGHSKVTLFGTRIHVTPDDPQAALATLKDALAHAGIPVTKLEIGDYSLEDVFLSLLDNQKAAAA